MAAGRSQSSCFQCMHIFYSENQNVVLVSQCTKIAYQKYKIGFTEKEKKKFTAPKVVSLNFFSKIHVYSKHTPYKTIVIYKCIIHILNYFKTYRKSSIFDIPGHINTFNIMKWLALSFTQDWQVGAAPSPHRLSPCGFGAVTSS